MNRSFSSLISQIKNDSTFSENVVFWKEESPQYPSPCEYPEWITADLVNSLRNIGINHLYTHQYDAIQLVHSGKNVVITTGTASGKSLCYQIPILDQLLRNNQSTALLFFPTKALTYDQLKTFTNILGNIEEDFDRNLAAIYDGDTPTSQRSLIRQKTRILLTNPDMLNIGILPHHTNWAQFFENLKYVVIDEIHLYKGVFGSHIANLVRRLKRILDFYGAKPQFIMTSATIANPIELAENLVEEEVHLVEKDGSPKGQKNFLIYNPPMINQDLGIREGVVFTSTKIASLLLYFDIQTLIFCQTRRFVEILVREIKETNPGFMNKIRGYRSGYLKMDRREIETGLKNGTIRLTVATNALELGVDIGGVDAVLLAGYPGSICSLRQRIGRGGRTNQSSVAILIASMNPLDQYLARNPQYLVDRPLEQALINPNNPLILLPHIKSAAFELPFKKDDSFGKLQWDVLDEYMQYLCSDGVLQNRRDRYYWLSETYPSNDYSLRSTLSQTVLIQYLQNDEVETIGEVDYNSALWMVHPGAVYLQDGLSFYVKDLDLEKGIATLVDHIAEYITEPVQSQDIEILSENKNIEREYYTLHYGEIEVKSKVTGYKKVQNKTREVLIIENLDLPETKLQTTGLWLEINSKCIEKMRTESLWLSDVNDYGKEWNKTRERIRQRDLYTCQSCGRVESGNAFHVHHKIPFKSFVSIDKANEENNLITLCSVCHRLAELNIRMRSALSGLRYVLSNLAPLLVLSEYSDLGSYAEPNAKYANMNPVIMIYDAIPAGIGLSNALYEKIDDLLERSMVLINQCECQDGCPSCVGPTSELGLGGKKETLFLLSLLSFK